MAARKPPHEREAQLLAAAVEICTAHGIEAVTRVAVARKVGVTDALINRYFEGRNGLRWETLRALAKAGNVGAIKQALYAGYSKSDLATIASRDVLRAASA